MVSYAGMMAAAVKVDMQAWMATRVRFVTFYEFVVLVYTLYCAR